MQLTLLKNYPDLIGAKQVMVGFGNGPKSYSQTTGDVVTVPRTLIDLLFGGVQSVSGTYTVQARPSFAGNTPSWALYWYVSATGAQVTAATDLSAEQVQVGGIFIAN